MIRRTDTFTDADGTLLTAHTAEGFGTWGVSSSTRPTILSNRCTFDRALGYQFGGISQEKCVMGPAGFDFFFDALFSATPVYAGSESLYLQIWWDAGTWTVPNTWSLYLSYADSWATLGGAAGWYITMPGVSVDHEGTAITSVSFYLAAAMIAVGGAFRIGWEFRPDGKICAFKEPAGGGTRTYLTDYLGVAVEGSWTPPAEAEAARYIEILAGVQTNDVCYIDNLTFLEWDEPPRSFGLAYRSPVDIAKWSASRQYALRFGLGGAGRWQRIAVVHGATTDVGSSDGNYFALYAMDVTAQPIKARTDSF